MKYNSDVKKNISYQKKSIIKSNNNMLKFHERIKKIIELVGSAEKLANISGMSSRVIGQYLAGKSEPSRIKLIALAAAAQVNIEWLATGKGPMGKGEQASINPDVLALVIEVFEEHEKETDDKLPPGQKAIFISALYDLCLDEDYTTEVGKKAVRELANMALSFKKTIDKAIESEKGRERVIKVLRREYKKIMSKEDAEFEAHEHVGVSVMMKHERKGTLKSIDDIKKMTIRPGPKK